MTVFLLRGCGAAAWGLRMMGFAVGRRDQTDRCIRLQLSNGELHRANHRL